MGNELPDNPKDKIKYYSDKLLADPINPYFLKFRANAYFKCKYFKKALLDYTNVLQLTPANP